MVNEEGAGQFSPTYISNEAALKLEENSAFAGEAQPFEPRSPSFEREESQPEVVEKQKGPAYNIDLFQDAKTKPKQVVSDSESSSGSSSSEDEDSGSSDDEPSQSNIDIPASVISRFFSSQEPITAYLQKRTKDSTNSMLDDLC